MAFAAFNRIKTLFVLYMETPKLAYTYREDNIVSVVYHFRQFPTPPPPPHTHKNDMHKVLNMLKTNLARTWWNKDVVSANLVRSS